MSSGDDRTHLGRPFTSLAECALFHRAIVLRCPACGHEVALGAAQLWWYFHRRRWGDAMRDVARRFYCGRCWYERGAKITGPFVSITRDLPIGPQPPDPPEREWKRLVSRYRS